MLRAPETPNTKQYTFFQDGKSRIDYVVVVPRSTIDNPDVVGQIITFVKTLQEAGIKVEQSYVSPNLFIKLHIPPNKLETFAHQASVNIKNSGHFVFEKQKKDTFFQSELTKNHGDFYFRKQGEVTTAERILILRSVMFLMEFPDGCSLSELKGKKLVLDAFPIHDGDAHFSWDDDDLFLNDRQLLKKYWGRFRLFYKEQPLNLLQKYYGSEVAFYFAWLGFYNVMLVPAAFIGFWAFFASMIKMLVVGHRQIDELCDEDRMMCPICHSIENCKVHNLKNSCSFSYWTYVFDNGFSIFISVFMSLWAILFLKLWRRKESILRVRWNLSRFESFDTKFRPEFVRRARGWRRMKLGHELEPCMPRSERLWRRIVSAFVLFCMILISLILVVLITATMLAIKALMRNTSNTFIKNNKILLSMIIGSILGVIVIKLYAKLLYSPVATFLTNLENTRTQQEYDNSMLYKSFFMGFINNNFVLLYTAFVKGHLYKPQNSGFIRQFDFDICHPSGCILGLTLQLSFILTLKTLAYNLIAIAYYSIKKQCSKLRKKCAKSTMDEDFIGMERELKLVPAPRLFLIKEYLEMVTQFCLITCYISAQPLAPLFALVNNIVELRLDAKKLACYYRRPEPKRVSGIGEWNRILFGIVLFGMITNGIVISFTSDFLPKAIYASKHRRDMIGYINTTLSAIDMNDVPDMRSKIIDEDNPICYYRARRYGPYHPSRYHLTTDHWYIFGAKFLFVILFEHCLLLINVFTTMAITEVPHWVKESYTRKQRTDDKERRELQQQRKANPAVLTKTSSSTSGMFAKFGKLVFTKTFRKEND